jgi:hypothetical protein
MRFIQLDEPLAQGVLGQIDTPAQVKSPSDVRAMPLDCVDADI